MLTRVRKRIARRLPPAPEWLLDFAAHLQHARDTVAGRDLWVSRDVRKHVVTCGSGDGAWVLCPDRLSADSVVYSVGVGRDISFDLDVIRRFGVTVHAFDPTPIAQDWLQTQSTPPQFHFHPWGLAAADGVVDFALPVSHGVSFTMLSGVASKRHSRGEVLTLASTLGRLGHRRIDVLKMDIEGAEYDVMPSLVEHAEGIDQLLVEFHHRMLSGPAAVDRTRQAIEQLRAAGFRLFNVSPRALEYSFIRG